ncbi:MAG TPA: tRNA threonylcarbamoyladenosine dehydratase [Flavobacteriales bacterium]|nr:tRNA threonylcarbamoyladenosine dehydratase [Flavobacteriales bacterium]HRE73947.1 tRNA threonylcarbamoyladenosine dehydratase [Flavobacteriales bacterium]HRE98271.1 tRNA threonylcarbamoyladenosine dehydratase [Flavobacteriales bacterium]HRJ36570.1 tRNA threonylcarbamoyladenosine dehydratase [Flavobacteriales bacterium]HRJ39005.1 tRNA threonylcarbamoyladenosine dehydratase [Flavobacteriales bacterium]
MKETAWLGRTKLLIGDERLTKLMSSNVLIVGLGGVGSFAAEFIVRAGVGKVTICDGDIVDPTNRNRQLPALSTTHGVSKAAWMQERLLAINPELQLTVINEFLRMQPMKELLFSQRYDYVIDAIDSITPKITLITTCHQNNIPIISSMGAGGKLDPTRIRVTDISNTFNCKLAHYVRKRLHRQKIYKGVKAVFSSEKAPAGSLMLTDGTNFKKSAYGTMSYLPAAFGGACASVVIRDLIQWKETV